METNNNRPTDNKEAESIRSNKRVVLAPGRSLARLKAVLIIILSLTMIGGFSFALLQKGPLYVSLLSAVVALIAAAMIYHLGKRVRSASLKGDTLILKGINNKSCVTSIRSVRNVRTYNLFGVPCTTLRYNLDGKTHTSILFGNPPGASISVEHYLRNAMQGSKKQKANL